MKKLIENMNEILDLPNKEVVYILKATHGKKVRLYTLKDYELLKRVYEYRIKEGWTCEISIC